MARWQSWELFCSLGEAAGSGMSREVTCPILGTEGCKSLWVRSVGLPGICDKTAPEERACTDQAAQLWPLGCSYWTSLALCPRQASVVLHSHACVASRHIPEADLAGNFVLLCLNQRESARVLYVGINEQPDTQKYGAPAAPADNGMSDASENQDAYKCS